MFACDDSHVSDYSFHETQEHSHHDLVPVHCLKNSFPLNQTFADEFVMLKNSKVNVRYGPSFEYPIKYIYLKKNLPIKVIDKKENFRRIIDHKHNSGWIHTSQLKKSSSVILIKNEELYLIDEAYGRLNERVEISYNNDTDSIYSNIDKWITL